MLMVSMFYRQESIAAVKGHEGVAPDGIGSTTPLNEISSDATVRVVIHTGTVYRTLSHE